MICYRYEYMKIAQTSSQTKKLTERKIKRNNIKQYKTWIQQKNWSNFCKSNLVSFSLFGYYWEMMNNTRNLLTEVNV